MAGYFGSGERFKSKDIESPGPGRYNPLPVKGYTADQRSPFLGAGRIQESGSSDREDSEPSSPKAKSKSGCHLRAPSRMSQFCDNLALAHPGFSANMYQASVNHEKQLAEQDKLHRAALSEAKTQQGAELSAMQIRLEVEMSEAQSKLKEAQTERDGLFSEYRGLIYTVARLTDKPVNSKHEAEEAVTSTLEFISNLKQEVSKKLGMMEKQIAVLEEAHSQQGKAEERRQLAEHELAAVREELIIHRVQLAKEIAGLKTNKDEAADALQQCKIQHQAAEERLQSLLNQKVSQESHQKSHIEKLQEKQEQHLDTIQMLESRLLQEGSERADAGRNFKKLQHQHQEHVKDMEARCAQEVDLKSEAVQRLIEMVEEAGERLKERHAELQACKESLAQRDSKLAEQCLQLSKQAAGLTTLQGELRACKDLEAQSASRSTDAEGLYAELVEEKAIWDDRMRSLQFDLDRTGTGLIECKRALQSEKARSAKLTEKLRLAMQDAAGLSSNLSALSLEVAVCRQQSDCLEATELGHQKEIASKEGKVSSLILDLRKLASSLASAKDNEATLRGELEEAKGRASAQGKHCCDLQQELAMLRQSKQEAQEQACNKQRCIEKLERQAEELRFTSSELQGCCSEYEKDLAECKQELRATITSKHRILAEADNLQMKHQTAQKRLAEALAQLNRVCSPVKKEERVLITT